jgi:hypothetical protein
LLQLSVLLLIPLFLLSMGSFVEYKVIYHFTQENQVEYGILVERVDRIFGNGSMLFNLTTGNLNQSIYMPSSLVLDNFTSPHYFLWVPRPGEREIYRGIQFTLLNETDGLFVYMGQQELDGISVVQYLFVNSSGVPSREVFIQVGNNGQIVSEVTYTLISSNLVDQHDTLSLPNLSQCTDCISGSIHISPSGLYRSLDTLIIGLGVISTITILLLRKKKLNVLPFSSQL